MKPYLLFFPLFLLYACHGGNTNVSTGNNTIIYDFPLTKTVESEKMDMEILGINTLLILDTFFIAHKASGYNDFFEIYSTNDLRYLGKCLPKGRGADEFLSVDYAKNCFLKNGDLVLWVSDPVLQKRALLNVTQSLRTGRTICDTVLRINTDYDHFYLNDSLVLLKKDIPGNIAFTIRNHHTGETISEHQLFKSYIPKSTPPHLLSMGITEHPEKNLFAGNMLFFNQINIFSADLKTNFSISYQPPVNIFETVNQPESSVTMYYSSIRASSEYIYALYLNKKVDSFPHGKGETELHVFNWEGEPIAKIQIPDNIVYFAVDEKHRYLYGVKGNEELFRYKLEI